MLAAQAIALGDCDVAVAGGAESISGAVLAARPALGPRYQDGVAVDAMVGALTDPFDAVATWASRRRTSRRECERVAASRAGRARGRRATGGPTSGHRSWVLQGADPAGRGDACRKGTALTVDADEHIRAPARRRTAWRSCGAAFSKDGSVTAGNASGVNDGAAAVVLADRKNPPLHHGAEPARAGRRLQPRRGRAEDHGHGPGARGAGRCSTEPTSRLTTLTCSR